MNILATFGDLGGLDGIFILFIILMLFGARRFPELARGLADAVRAFSNAKDEIDRETSGRPAPPRVKPTPEALFILALSIIAFVLIVEYALHQR